MACDRRLASYAHIPFSQKLGHPSKFFENKIENKRSVIKGFHRTPAVTRFRRITQSQAGLQSPKDTRCHHRIAPDCGSVMTSDQTVGSSSLSERAE
jgi:hypothetical protein